MGMPIDVRIRRLEIQELRELLATWAWIGEYTGQENNNKTAIMIDPRLEADVSNQAQNPTILSPST